MFIAEEVTNQAELEGVIGIQICDQAICDAPGMYNWYNSVCSKLADINPALPIYVSDGWNITGALQWSKDKNAFPGPSTCPVLVETHRYYTFDDTYKALAPHHIIANLGTELQELTHDTSGSITDHGGAVAVYVGEYSCALSAETLNRTAQDQWNDITIRFGKSQCRQWQERATGAAFWTLKTPCLDDLAWNFAHQVRQGTIIHPEHFAMSSEVAEQKFKEADRKRSHLMAVAMSQHTAYFAKLPGRYEHWRYADGWHLGYTDAGTFFASRLQKLVPGFETCSGSAVIGTDTIGALDLWILKRMKEEEAVNRDKCEFMWEWEHGFRAGVKSFYEVVGL